MELYGYRRPDGSVGVRNHVIILPVDDISNAACRGSRREDHRHARAPARLRPAPVRRGPRVALPHDDRNRREPQRRRRDRDRDRAELDRADRGGDRGHGEACRGFSIEGKGELEIVRQASLRPSDSFSRRPSSGASTVELGELTVSIKCGESDTTTGLGSCPTVGAWWTAGRRGRDRLLRRDLRAHRRRAPGRCAHAPPTRSASSSSQPTTLRRGDRGGRRRPARLAADPGEHRRRALDDRGESARQHPEDGQPPGRRCARARARRRDAGAGLYFMDSSSAAAEYITLMAPPAPSSTSSRPDRATSSATRSSR